MTRQILFALCLLVGRLCTAGFGETPKITRISPTGGPEGTRIEVSGRNLEEVKRVVFGTTEADFKIMSAAELVVIVPHRTASSVITVITQQTRAASPFSFVVLNDPRVPEEASYKSGYVNSTLAPEGFSSVLLWGIAIADTRVSGYASATVEVAWTQLSCGRMAARSYLTTIAAGCGEVYTGAIRGLAVTSMNRCRWRSIRPTTQW